MIELKHACHSVYKIRYHMVFCIKYRKKLLFDKDRIEFFKEICSEIGTVTQMVVCAIATTGKKHDSTQFETMVNMVAAVFSIKEWLGDAGYLSRKACNLVSKEHGVPFFWPKSNSTNKSRGSYA